MCASAQPTHVTFCHGFMGPILHPRAWRNYAKASNGKCRQECRGQNKCKFLQTSIWATYSSYKEHVRAVYRESLASLWSKSVVFFAPDRCAMLCRTHPICQVKATYLLVVISIMCQLQLEETSFLRLLYHSWIWFNVLLGPQFPFEVLLGFHTDNLSSHLKCLKQH